MISTVKCFGVCAHRSGYGYRGGRRKHALKVTILVSEFFSTHITDWIGAILFLCILFQIAPKLSIVSTWDASMRCLCNKTEKIPTDMKIAIVKPVLRKCSSNTKKCENYRPVSHLHCISKILRKLFSRNLPIT